MVYVLYKLFEYRSMQQESSWVMSLKRNVHEKCMRRAGKVVFSCEACDSDKTRDDAELPSLPW